MKELQDTAAADAGGDRGAEPADSTRECTRRSNDPRRPERPPARDVIPPALNFAPLENAATALAASAARSAGGRPVGAADGGDREAVNAKLRQAERQLTDRRGLPGRPWFRHMLYAPGLYTGYGVKTIPGVREAIEQKQYGTVEAEVVRAAAAIDRLTKLLDAATGELTP